MRGSYIRDILLVVGALLALLIGLATPAYFRAVAPETLTSIGEGSPGLTEEADKLVRAAKVGPYQILKKVGLPDSTYLDKRMDAVLASDDGSSSDSVYLLAGTASAVDVENFRKYFGGLDPFNRGKGRNAAFFVFNHAYRQGVLKNWLESKSNNQNVKRILQSVPTEGRPGAFWSYLLSNPQIRDLPGAKIVKLDGFRFFPDRRLALSVAIQSTKGLSEEDLETAIDACRKEARLQLDVEEFEIERFCLRQANGHLELESQDASLSAKVTAGSIGEISGGFEELAAGSTEDGEFYYVILGGVLGPNGNLEAHGRWLPYPMLVPMMLGTAMFVETGYLDTGTDPGYELGNLSTGMLQGDLPSKERLRAAYWSIYQLASRLNWGQMAELLDSCPNLQAVDDMAALVRLAFSKTSELNSRKKRLLRLQDNLSDENKKEEVASELNSLQLQLDHARADSALDLATVYASALLSDNPSAVLRYIRTYPVSGDDQDERALADLRSAMSKGTASLNYLLELALPVYEPGWALSAVSPLFPLVGGNWLVELSHSHRKSAFFIKGCALAISFVLVTMAFVGFLPSAQYRKDVRSTRVLRLCRNLSCGAFGSLVAILALEPSLLQTPSTGASRAGFDFALANLVATASSQTMPDNLTLVTGLVAGGFLLLQIIIYVFCLMRISEVRKQVGKVSLKLELLDNEDNLFDLGLYVGLGGTVLSLVLLLILEVKQDALIGAYASTLFGIIFVAILKIFHVRPYRNELLVARSKEMKQ
ncbi:MAG: hypothetical protein CMI31_01420 [Opitutae bacterium]|nr:hypothetical protein [Opitutae bacterium]